MKSTDIALIILISAISILVAYFGGNALLGNPDEKVEEIEYMNVISGELPEPDMETFNAYAINPTVDVYVGSCAVDEVWNSDLYMCVEKGGPDDPSASDNQDESSNPEEVVDAE